MGAAAAERATRLFTPDRLVADTVALYLVLDSTVLIDYLRGRGVADRVDSALEAGEMLATTSVNVEEIVRGLRYGQEEPARLLFEGLVVLDIGRRGLVGR
ncbi:MAG: PIN domain-containing protein [Acidimicrobiales bacterium]